MDVSEWMRVFAMEQLGSVADTYLQDKNHNIRVYTRPSDGRVLAFPWDMDGAFSGEPVSWGRGNLTKVIGRPPYTRMYYGHMHDMLTTTFNRAYMSYWTNHYGELGNESFDHILDVISNSAEEAERLLPAQVPFEITSHDGSDVSVDTATLALEGSAWINVKDVRVESLPDPLELRWTSVQNWQASERPGT